MEAGASGDITICIMRRNGTVGIPIWLWLGGVWVDVATLTAAQFSAYVNARLATDVPNPNGYTSNPDSSTSAVTPAIRLRVDGLTISKDQF